MKGIVYLLLFLALPASQISSAQDWLPMGPDDRNRPSHGVASNTNLFFEGDIPYLAFRDGILGNRASVRYYQDGQWQYLGEPGFSAGQVSTMAMALNQEGVPYVAYRDWAHGHRATVQFFDGMAWQTLGGAGFSGDEVRIHDIAFDSQNIPYLIVRDNSVAGRATVLFHKEGQWQTLGGPGITASATEILSLVFDSQDRPYFAYADSSVEGRLTVRYFDGTTWQVLGSPGISELGVANPYLAINGADVLYLVYGDLAHDNRATVQFFDGDSWQVLGAAGFTEHTAYNTSLIFDHNQVLHMAYKAFDETVAVEENNRVNVVRYSDAGWETVGNPNISRGGATHIALDFDAAGRPYAAYVDNTLGNRAVVQGYTGTAWTEIGTTGIAEGLVGELSFAANTYGVPFVLYGDGVRDYKAAVRRFQGGAWKPVGELGISAGHIQYPSLGFDGEGLPYIAYSDGGQEDKVVVKHFDGQLGLWENVGGLTAISDGAAKDIHLSVDAQGLPYILYTDMAQGNRPLVQYYNGVAWEVVGETYLGQGEAIHTALAVDESGNPYMAQVSGTEQGKVTVRYYNGTAWELLGELGNSNDPVLGIDLNFDAAGLPLITYRKGAGMEVGTRVMKFQNGNWETVGASGILEAGDTQVNIGSGFQLAYSEAALAKRAGMQQFVTDYWELMDSGISAGAVTHLGMALDFDRAPMLAYSTGYAYAQTRGVPFEDIQAPEIVSCDDLEFRIGNAACGAEIQLDYPEALDNFSFAKDLQWQVSRSDGQPLEAPFPIGDTFVQWQVADEFGNTSTSCEQRVTVVDIEFPVITSQVQDGRLLLDAGAGYAGYEWSTGETTQTIEASPGDYWVTVNPGQACALTSEVFTVSENAVDSPQVLGFLLVDAYTGETLQPLYDQDRINIQNLDTHALDIRVLVNATTLGVAMELTGTASLEVLDSTAPFRLFGPEGVAEQYLSPGVYSLEVMAQGEWENAVPLTISFELYDPEAVVSFDKHDQDLLQQSVRLYPNPVRTVAHFRVDLPEIQLNMIYVHDMRGRLMNAYLPATIYDGERYSIPVAAFPVGAYVVTLIERSGVAIKKRMLVFKE